MKDDQFDSTYFNLVKNKKIQGDKIGFHPNDTLEDMKIKMIFFLSTLIVPTKTIDPLDVCHRMLVLIESFEDKIRKEIV